MTLKGWRQSPFKVPDITWQDAFIQYEGAKERSRKPPITGVPKSFFVRKYRGKNYYMVSVLQNHNLRKYRAENWRQLGYKVRVVGDNIYVRKEGF